MKTTMEKSRYLMTSACTKCDYVEVPPLLRLAMSSLRFIPPLDSCCPRCGARLKKAVGCFEMTTHHKGLFGVSSTISYKFVPSQHQEEAAPQPRTQDPTIWDRPGERA